jgi:hypothetical protein
MISDKQREEWTENPVTIELLKLINVQLIDLVSTPQLIDLVSTPTADCLVYGDPNKSHENLVQQDMIAHMLAMFRFALEGDWDYFEEIEEDDQ